MFLHEVLHAPHENVRLAGAGTSEYQTVPARTAGHAPLLWS